MTPPSARSRASIATYSESEAAELEAYIGAINLAPAEDNKAQLQEELNTAIKATHCIRQLFRDNAHPNRIRDAFRHLQGFQNLLNSFQTAVEVLLRKDCGMDESQAILDALQSLIGLLMGALQDHWGNRRYFRKRVREGGWDALGAILRGIFLGRPSDAVSIVRERLFGALLACALEDDTLNGYFSDLRRSYALENKDTLARENQTKLTDELANKDTGASVSDDMIRSLLGPYSFVHNPEAIRLTLELWLSTAAVSKKESHAIDIVSLSLPAIVKCLAVLSTHNLVSLHVAGLLQVILPVFVESSHDEQYLEPFKALAGVLLSLGVTDLNDAHFLYHHASASSVVAELLRLSLIKSHLPPCIHFDLDLYGFASVELPDIGRSFPPLGSGSGYTLSLWLEVVQFDSDSHTTLFGAFDSSQTCFVLVYLEKDTQNLILQTSVTASRPSVRFKSFTFQAGRWYHLCLVHRRAKATSSSRASLFIDGEFVEQVKAQYPSPPPRTDASTANQDLPSASRQHKPVQAFLGTPQDLAARIGRCVVSSQWRLASAYLFSDTLSDDLIAVHKQLGPRYHGNYQDCLGSFQTYEASAALNLRNESLHPGKEENSEIVAAIRAKASLLLPESRILLNFSPMMVLDDDERNNIDETQLIKSLSKAAAKNLRAVTRGGRSAIVINGAVPSINEALLRNNGFAVITGEPAIVIPQSLDGAAWCIGGCAPVGLALVESANSGEDLIRALDILFGCIHDSWRNSEAMERDNGFGVLASLLTAKLDSVYAGPRMQELRVISSDMGLDELTFQVLSIVLKFIGYCDENLADSVINNPLAYRILVVDLDLWRTSSDKVQKLYYEQFETFGTGSKHRLFNVKRLARMR